MRKNRWYLLPLCLVLIHGLALAEWVSRGSGMINSNCFVISLSAVSENVVWAAGVNGSEITESLPEVTRTTDGGLTWSAGIVPYTPDYFVILDVCAVSADTAWVAMNDFEFTGGIFKTTDGGSSWSWQRSAEGPALWVYFFDAASGVAMNYDLIYTTVDGGDHWTRVPLPDIPKFLPGEALVISSTSNGRAQAGDTIWFATSRGRVFRSSDRGRHWRAFETGLGPDRGINSIAFRDSRNGMALSCVDSTYYLAPNRIVKTSDGGETWSEVSAPTAVTASSLSAVPDAGGAYMMVSAGERTGSAFTADDGKTWQVIDRGYYNAVSFLSPGVGWAGGVVAPYDGGGLYGWAGPLPGPGLISMRGSKGFKPHSTKSEFDGDTFREMPPDRQRLTRAPGLVCPRPDVRLVRRFR